jgi:hypothetical protein
MEMERGLPFSPCRYSLSFSSSSSLASSLSLPPPPFSPLILPASSPSFFPVCLAVTGLRLLPVPENRFLLPLRDPTAPVQAQACHALVR